MSDGKMFVKVNVTIKGIHNHDPTKITSVFDKRSLSIQIEDLGGKNLQFSVPKTQCLMVPERCKIGVRTDRITISIRKVNESDNWFALYKTKTIGGDSD